MLQNTNMNVKAVPKVSPRCMETLVSTNKLGRYNAQQSKAEGTNACARSDKRCGDVTRKKALRTKSAKQQQQAAGQPHGKYLHSVMSPAYCLA
jgi:hypothetical protein